ncbi:MAG: riboflavin synthase [Fimbriimonadaceae bacterium]|nr:riboflavin synthase [Fimbriimonadaceae bacterium]
MFTGLVQAQGRLVSLDGSVLTVEAPGAWKGGALEPGESIAVDGCCLTWLREPLVFELSEETLARTCFARMAEGKNLNLERALRAGDRLGGHIVQGHVDEVGKAVEIDRRETGARTVFECAKPHYLVEKGSVTVNGVSLTVSRIEVDKFECWLVPETLARTNLADLRAGDGVHIEYDVLAKYVESLLLPRL